MKMSQEIGFDFQGTSFESRIQALQCYQETHGHMRVSKEEDKSLHNFIKSVKLSLNWMKQGKTPMIKLKQDGITNLEQIGPKLAQVGPKWAQVGSRLVQIGPKLAQVGAKFVPSLLKLAGKLPKLAPSWPNLAPSGPKVAPSWPKLVPSWPQIGPIWCQVG